MIAGAVAQGYKAIGQLQTDPDLDPMRQEPEYIRRVDELKEANAR